MVSSISRRPALLLALAFGLIYCLWPTRNYYWDGVAFAVVIERAQHQWELLSVHHLLYEFVGEAMWLASGKVIRALYLMQALNCVAGVIYLLLLHRLLKDLGVAASNALAWTALAGAAATFWRFTTDADSYILTNVLLLCAVLLARRGSSPVLVAASHVGAMMLHQLAALLYPVLLFYTWQRSRTRAVVYGLLAPGVTLGIYWLAFRSIPAPESPTLLGWVTYHAKVPFFFHAGNNARWLLLGTLRLFAGGKLGRFELTLPVVGACVILLAGLLACVRFARGAARLRTVTEWPIIAWTAIYLVFLFFWEPYNTFYRLFYLAPLIAALAIATREWKPQLISSLAVVLAAWNFVFVIYPDSLAKNNPPLTVAQSYHSQWPAGTGVVFGQFVPDLWTISYFNPQASWISMEQPDPARLASYAEEFGRSGKSVWVDWTYLQHAGEPAREFTFRRIEPARSAAAH